MTAIDLPPTALPRDQSFVGDAMIEADDGGRFPCTTR